VVATDMADAAKYVSRFVSGPHLNEQYTAIQPMKATVLVVEQAFFKEPHITEKANVQIIGFRHKESETEH